MSNFFSFVQNENMKIYRRPRNWIMAGFIVLALVLVTVLSTLVSDGKKISSDNWKPKLEQTIVSLKGELQKNAKNVDNPYFKSLEKRIKIAEYQLEHQINPYQRTLWGAINELSPILQLAIVFTIVVAADMIASEFTWGTIKLLLIRPASRVKILASKYVSTLLYALFLVAITFVVSLIIGIVLNGFSGFSQPDLYIGADGSVHERSMLFAVLQTYGLGLVQLLMYVTLAFTISSAFRSASMAIALSLACMFVGTAIVGMFSKYEWVKYILFANINLNQYLDGTPLRPEMTMTFSIVVLLVYFAVFHLISWLLFTKRDVAA